MMFRLGKYLKRPESEFSFQGILLLLEAFVHYRNWHRDILLHTRRMCKKFRIIRVDIFYIKICTKRIVIESQNISHNFRSQAAYQEVERCSRLLDVLDMCGLLANLDLFQSSALEPAGQFSTKHDIDLLERQALGLWHAEVDKDDRESRERGKDKVRAEANVGDHVRHRSGNDKVEQPMSGSAQSHTQTSDAKRENLRAVDPWYSSV